MPHQIKSSAGSAVGAGSANTATPTGESGLTCAIGMERIQGVQSLQGMQGVQAHQRSSMTGAPTGTIGTVNQGPSNQGGSTILQPTPTHLNLPSNLSRSSSDGDNGLYSLSVQNFDGNISNRHLLSQGELHNLSFYSRRSGSEQTLSEYVAESTSKHRMKETATEDMSYAGSDDISVSSEKSTATCSR